MTRPLRAIPLQSIEVYTNIFALDVTPTVTDFYLIADLALPHLFADKRVTGGGEHYHHIFDSGLCAGFWW